MPRWLSLASQPPSRYTDSMKNALRAQLKWCVLTIILAVCADRSVAEPDFKTIYEVTVQFWDPRDEDAMDKAAAGDAVAAYALSLIYGTRLHDGEKGTHWYEVALKNGSEEAIQWEWQKAVEAGNPGKWQERAEKAGIVEALHAKHRPDLEKEFDPQFLDCIDPHPGGDLRSDPKPGDRKSRPDDGDRIKTLTAKAEKVQDGYFSYCLATYYFYASPDYKKATLWFRKAFDQGITDAALQILVIQLDYEKTLSSRDRNQMLLKGARRGAYYCARELARMLDKDRSLLLLTP
jgi:TPR repeat protein